MVRLTRPRQEMQIIASDQRVDFALEVPNLVKVKPSAKKEKEKDKEKDKDKDKDKWLRIVVEIDDTSHQGRGQRALDAQRDELLKSNGWEVWRLNVKGKSRWRGRANELAQALRAAVTDEVLQTAKDIREKLSEESRQALTDLVLLPIVEAQLLVLTARWLHAYGTAAVRIANPQKLNLQPVLDCVNECLTQLERLYG
jgi:hypothetical protein